MAVSDLYKGFIIGQEGTPGRFNSKNYGVYITGEGVYNVPMRDVELITIPGRNGALIKDNGRYENIQVTYHCGMFGDDQTDFASNLASFRQRLAQYTYGSYLAKGVVTFYLYDDYNPDEFRLATYLGGLEVESASLGQAGQFDITFECKPQRFLKSGDTYKELSASPWVQNPTAWASAPRIRFQMTGTSGTIELSNSSFGSTPFVQTITITNAPQNEYIYIDCEIGEAFTGSDDNPVSVNQYVSLGANLPILERGITNVTWSSSVTNVAIMPRWWKL